jgi:hypothetical protein
VPKAFTPGAVGSNNALVMNLEDPRVQVADQNWTVTFEGNLPGFDQLFATLTLAMPGVPSSKGTLQSPQSSIQFCDHGVLSKGAFTAMLPESVAQGAKTTLTDADLADYVQITSAIPDASDSYWTTGFNQACANLKLNYSACFNEFGATDAPELMATRDLRILEAYQDHVEVEARPQGQDLNHLLCCFPAALNFTVRVGHQWAVVADQSGFVHHVVADATTGMCRNACDPTLIRKNSRLIEAPSTFTPTPVPDRGPDQIDPSPSFQNPMFRFAVLSGQTRCKTDSDCALAHATIPSVCTQGICADPVVDGPQPAQPPCASDAQCTAGDQCFTMSKQCFHRAPRTVLTQRDSVFRFMTVGSFSPLLIPLATDAVSLILPRSITYLPTTMELAVTDGSNNGLIMVSLQTAAVSRTFF